MIDVVNKVYESKGKVDLVILSEYVRTKNKGLKMAYVAKIYGHPSTNANIGEYVSTVRNKSLLRKIIEAGVKIQGMGFNEGTEIMQTVSEAEELVKDISAGRQNESDLRNYNGEDQIVFANTLYEELEEQLRNTENAGTTRDTGIAKLDEMTGGFILGQLNLISGIPGMGKSSFIRTLIYRLYKKYKTKSLYLMFEETPTNVLRKLKEKTDKFKDPNYLNFYLPKKHVYESVEWIESKMLEAKLKFGIDMVFIDHLDDIYRMEDGKSEEQSIRHAVKALKKFAVRNEMIVFLIAHVQKKKDEGRPKMSDLKGSASLQGEPDNIIFVHRIPDISDNGEPMFGRDGEPSSKLNLAKLYLDKNREGGIKGYVTMAFDLERGLYYDYLHSQRTPEPTTQRIKF